MGLNHHHHHQSYSHRHGLQLMSTLRVEILVIVIANSTPSTLTISLGEFYMEIPMQNVRLLLLVIRPSPLQVNQHTPQKNNLVSVFQVLYTLPVIKNHTRITTQLLTTAKITIRYLTVFQWIVLKYPLSDFPDACQTHGHHCIQTCRSVPRNRIFQLLLNQSLMAPQ